MIPKLSVIVPVYNVGRFLEDCLNSLHGQNYKDFECILVDDGSTDESSKLCDDFCALHKRFKVTHQSNKGASEARKLGLMQAKGEFVAFVDGDDVVAPDMFERLLLPMINDNGIDISVCNFETFKERVIYQVKKRVYVEHFNSQEGLTRMIEQDGFNWSLWGKAYRRRFFIENSDIDNWPESYGEDMYINRRLFYKSRDIAYSDFIGYFYRVRDNSLMNMQFTSKQIIYLKIWLQTYSDALKYPNNDRIISAIKMWLLCVGLHLVWRLWHIELDFTLKEQLNDYCRQIGSILSDYKEWLPHQQKLYQWTILENDNIKRLIDKEREVLFKFKETHPNLWIYGTGAISKDVVLLMEFLHIEFAGFVVTHKNISAFSGKPVFSLDELCAKQTSNIGFILAMNKRNCKEVTKELNLRDFQKSRYLIWRV